MTQKMQQSPKRPSRLRSLTRLMVGGALVGYDVLLQRLSAKELELDQRNASEGESATQGDKTDVRDDKLRLALIGLIFDMQDTLDRGLETADQASRLTGKALETMLRPIYSSRLLSPMRNRFEQLALRGQQEVDRWIEIGRREETIGKELANTVLVEQVSDSIEYLAANEKVQELVQSQSVGLIGEIVEETRERSVSADNYLEAWVRTMLRRPMRSELPKPPPELKARAVPYRRIQGKVVKK